MRNRLKKSSCGMTLLEVLVSLLLVGGAMVGSIAMIQSSVRFNQAANQQSMALYSAQEIIGRMRANAHAGESYVTYATEYLTNDFAPKASVKDCFNSPDHCTPEDWAKSDLSQWYTDMVIALPGLDLKNTGIQKESSDNNLYKMTIFWDSDDKSLKLSSSKPSAERHADESKAGQCQNAGCFILYFSI